ncbi:hypothetical protein CRG98_035798 [Punica granatum]|uniref:Uncharacterized protein n=1 Tax=Punica granatum TaxID=22663 RepID=A0A2I0IIF6_PUNGR|nr:hypothetical protein CRG98_035798 [Punica granatum]
MDKQIERVALPHRILFSREWFVIAPLPPRCQRRNRAQTTLKGKLNPAGSVPREHKNLYNLVRPLCSRKH